MSYVELKNVCKKYKGNDKNSVTVNSAVQPVNAMEKLYMTVLVN